MSVAPGGTLVQDAGPGKNSRTETCLFGGPATMEHVKGWEQVHFVKESCFELFHKMFFR